MSLGCARDQFHRTGTVNCPRGRLGPATPSSNGCVECLATEDGWWFHLRRGVQWGHIMCRDQSPSQHTSKQAAAAQHPMIQSFEGSAG
jgi:hypothetical protein